MLRCCKPHLVWGVNTKVRKDADCLGLVAGPTRLSTETVMSRSLGHNDGNHDIMTNPYIVQAQAMLVRLDSVQVGVSIMELCPHGLHTSSNMRVLVAEG